MASRDDDPLPVMRVGLKRLTPVERVLSDEGLSASAVVQVLPRPVLEALLAASTARRFPAGVRIFEEGDLGGSLYLVLRGEARLWARPGGEGEPQEFGVAARGELFGEGAEGRRSCAAVAAGELDVLELPAEAVAKAARDGGERGLPAHLRALAEQRRAARDEMSDFLGRW